MSLPCEGWERIFRTVIYWFERLTNQPVLKNSEAGNRRELDIVTAMQQSDTAGKLPGPFVESTYLLAVSLHPMNRILSLSRRTLLTLSELQLLQPSMLTLRQERIVATVARQIVRRIGQWVLHVPRSVWPASEGPEWINDLPREACIRA